MDNRTMVFMLIITCLLCSLLMIISSSTRRRLPGSRSLSAWLVLQTAGLAFISAQGYTSVFLGIILSNTLLVASVIFLSIGLLQFLKLKINRYFLIAYTIIYIILTCIFTYIIPLTYIRVALFSSFVAFIDFFTGFLCIKNVKKSGATSLYIIILILALNVLFYLIRTISAFINPMQSIFNSDMMTTVIILIIDFTVIGITLSFIILQNQKLIEQGIEMKTALQKGEERYRETLDNMLEGCQIIGFDFTYIYVNSAAAKQGKYVKEELTGHKMTERFPGIEDTEMFKTLKYCMEKRAAKNFENRFTFPDGSMGSFFLSFQPVPEGIFILSEDITERKNAEEKLQSTIQRIYLISFKYA